MKTISHRSLSIQILIGCAMGFLFGFFFKEHARSVAPLGRAFVMLLEMPVLLFMFCSIIIGVGSMTLNDAKRIFTYVLVFLAGAWALTKFSISLIPLAFPPIGKIHKFASIQGEHSSELGLINAFIPGNPFKSFADGTVPAIVVFSIFFAIALLRVKNREPLLRNFLVVQEASIIIATWITKLSLFGAFFLTATAIANLNFFAVPELKYYYCAFIFGSIFISVILLPLAITIFLPISYHRLLAPLSPALLLALVSGNMLITLPLVLSAVRINMNEVGYNDNKLFGLTATLVPLTVNFPVSGKLLNLLFIYFVSWHYQEKIVPSEEMELSTVGILTAFGSAQGGIAYLLNTLKLPSDALSMFSASLDITQRFIALSRVASISALCFFTITSFEHRLTFKVKPLMVTLMVACLGFGTWFLAMKKLASPINEEPNIFLKLTIENPAQSKILKNADQISGRVLKTGLFEAIKHEKTLRVGFNVNTKPFAFFNNEGQLVGYDIELANMLANDLGVKIIFVPFDFNQLIPLLNSHKIDVAMSAVTITNERMAHIAFTNSYFLSEHVLVTKDFNQSNFDQRSKIEASPDVVIAVLRGSSFYEQAKIHFPNKNIVQLNNYDDFIPMGDKSLLYWATPQATYWTMVNPEFGLIRLPDFLGHDELAFPLPWDAHEFIEYLNRWLSLRKDDGTLDRLYKKWILGQSIKE